MANKPTDVNLRGMDRDLINRSKARAARLGLTLKDWIVGLLKWALDQPTENDPVRNGPNYKKMLSDNPKASRGIIDPDHAESREKDESSGWGEM